MKEDFVAQHVVPAMDVVRGGPLVDGIVLAGSAAGIEYWNHAELVDDGARAADASDRSSIMENTDVRMRYQTPPNGERRRFRRHFRSAEVALITFSLMRDGVR